MKTATTDKYAVVDRSRSRKSFCLYASTKPKRNGVTGGFGCQRKDLIRSGFASFDDARDWGIANGYAVFGAS